jgi:deoxyinosine 3'endonuclease (endonuclease V)
MGESELGTAQYILDNPSTSIQSAADENSDGTKNAEAMVAAVDISYDASETSRIRTAWLCCECSNINLEERLPCWYCLREYCSWCIPAML